MIHKLEITNWDDSGVQRIPGQEDNDRATGGYCWCGWRVEDYHDLLGAFNEHLDYSRSKQDAVVVIENQLESLAKTKRQMMEDSRNDPLDHLNRPEPETIKPCPASSPHGSAGCIKMSGHEGDHMNRGGTW